MAIQADVDDVLAQLIPHIEAQPREHSISWWRTCSKNSLQYSPENNPLSHYGLINAVAACVDDNAIITTDVGQRRRCGPRRLIRST